MNPMVRTLKALTGLCAAAVLGLGLTAYPPAHASIITYSVTGTADGTLANTAYATPSGTTLSGTITFNTTTQTSPSNTLNYETLTGWLFASYTPTNSVVTFGIGPRGAVYDYTLSLSLTNVQSDDWASFFGNGFCQANTTQCYDTISTTVTPIAAPAPPAWLMMLTGLGLLAPLYRRYKRGRRTT